MLETKDLSKHFGGNTALCSVSLSIPQGTICGLTGQKGAGKSTLLRHLAGVYPTETGEVILDGEEIFENAAAKERIAFVAEKIAYYPSATVKNLRGLYLSSYPNFDEDLLDELCGQFRVNSRQRICSMSLGNAKLAAFCLAMSTRADVLVLDALLDPLDTAAREQVCRLLREETQRRQLIVVISAADERLLEGLCSQTLQLTDGQLCNAEETQGGAPDEPENFFI